MIDATVIAASLVVLGAIPVMMMLLYRDPGDA